MNVIFMGTPEFALPSLEALINSEHNILAVITQTDKPRGRNKKLLPPPVKEFALKHGLCVLQYEKLREQAPDELRQLNPDIMITAAYGQIISKEILDIPRFGVINVHASVLPKYRGAMPVNWALMKGETSTGITIMQTDEGLDTGGILLSEKINIEPNETAGELLNRLSILGGKMLIDALQCIESGEIHLKKQNQQEATYYPIIKKEDAHIDFNKPALEIHNFVRGLNPAPCAFTLIPIAEGQTEALKVWKTRVIDSESDGFADAGEAGRIIKADKTGLWVKCSEGMIELTEIQPPNSARMSAQAFLNGRKLTNTHFI